MQGLQKMFLMRWSNGGCCQFYAKRLADFLDRFEARVGLGAWVMRHQKVRLTQKMQHRAKAHHQDLSG
jgi:hypothetical protein